MNAKQNKNKQNVQVRGRLSFKFFRNMWIFFSPEIILLVFTLYYVILYPLDCSVFVLYIIVEFLIQSYFRYLVMLGSVKSAWGIMSQQNGLLCDASELAKSSIRWPVRRSYTVYMLNNSDMKKKCIHLVSYVFQIVGGLRQPNGQNGGGWDGFIQNRMNGKLRANSFH